MGAGLSFAQPASAAVNGDTSIVWGGISWPKASAYFQENGDELRVCDIAKDGFGAWAGLYERSSNKFLKSISVGGSGNCRTNTGNIKEGTLVYIKLCLTKNNVNDACVKSNYGYA
ncbi:hypothetical protein ACIRG4_10590 [Streptomyces sp. NPDC102395]|uniref:hypothetical protein n=1 Tax=Streptomyces sp. NPDC102395 TaxID=3366168 RepID=UPI00380BB3D1